MSSRFVILSAIVIFAIGTSFAIAQTSGEPPRPDAEEQTRIDRELDVRIKFCRQLMLDQNWAGAADMLEILYEAHPGNPVVVSLLVQCYDNLQLYSKSEEIIRRHLAANPDNFNFRLLYAEVLAKQGQFEKSAEAYMKATDGVALSNQVRYQVVVQSMVTQGLDSATMKFIDRLRLETGDSSLFAIQRGTVLERQRLYDSAAGEFYSLLKDTTSLGNNAEKKLLALLSFAESETPAERFLLGRPDLFQQPIALRILSSHYLKSGQFEKAFEFTIRQDSLEGLSGRNLENLMRSCSEHRMYDQTVRTGEYLFARHQQEGVRDDAYFIYGDALVRLGRYREAINIYREVSELTRQKRYEAEALFRVGKVFLDNLTEYDTALTYFDSVMAFHSSSPSYLPAMVSRPHCYLREGSLDEALRILQGNASRPLQAEFKEQTLFDLAMAYLFRKEIDSSKATLSRLLVETPRGVYVNDAVRLLFTMDQAQENNELLYDYSNALFFMERRMEDSAKTKFNLIVEADDRGLADIALYELARLSLTGADTAGAIEYIDRLAGEFPESYHLPYGLRIKADLYSTTADRQLQARDIYRQLLENYPNFPFISDVRQRVRQLEERLGSS